MSQLIKCCLCGRFGDENDFWTYKKKAFLFPVSRDFNGWLKLNKLINYYEGKCYTCTNDERRR